MFRREINNSNHKFGLDNKECRHCGTYETGFGCGVSMDFKISYHKCEKCGHKWETTNYKHCK